MSANPGTSEQDGVCEATPETEKPPQLSLAERLRRLPNDVARSLFIDKLIDTATAKLGGLKPGCQTT
jgi:hypothetical protein